MYKKDFNAWVKKIKLLIDSDFDNAITEYENFVDQLHEEDEVDFIIQLHDMKKVGDLSAKSFYTAYHLRSRKRNSDARRIYKNILLSQPNNVSVLNNLSSILEEDSDIEEAFTLIDKAYSLIDDDEIVESNYNRIKVKIEAIEKKKNNFMRAATNVENENSFVRSKLENFFSNVVILEEYEPETNTVAIPNWQFRVLMKTDEMKGNSLRQQWLDKGYICETERRNEYRSIVYEINPYVSSELEKIALFKIDDRWVDGINRIDKDYLDKVGYFESIKKLQKVKVKYKEILLRDYNEFIISYLFENHKSVIVLSGSLIETLLIYFLEKKKVKKVEYSLGNRQVSKKLFDSQLGDLLNYLEDNNMLSRQLVHLGNVTRLYRNYIHPGKELRESSNLDKVKAELCFNSVGELINEVIR